jgi:hypothetical protein
MAFGIAKGLVTLRVWGFAARILPVISTGSVCAHLQSTRLSMREFAQFARTRETDPASARSYTGNGLGPIGASSLRSFRARFICTQYGTKVLPLAFESRQPPRVSRWRKGLWRPSISGPPGPHCLTFLRLFLANARPPFTRKLMEVIVPSHPNLAFDSLAILTSSGPGNRSTAGTTLRAAISSEARTRTVPSTFNAKTKSGTNSSSSYGCNSAAIPYPTPRFH